MPLGNKSDTMTVDTALDLLQAAAAEIEEESEVYEYFLVSLLNQIKNIIVVCAGNSTEIPSW